jgi:uncharacterized protein (DUF433 family)
MDPNDVPFYHLGTAARWVGVPRSTLNKWVNGRNEYINGKLRYFAPLIVAADLEHSLLSFANIAEAYILASTRRKYLGKRISFADIRAAIDLVQADDPTAAHPLLSGKFFRRGRRLFVESLSEKISASSPNKGQRFLADFDAHMERIEVSRKGRIRLFPIRRNENQTVVLNSEVAGGRPIIAGTGILVEFLQDLKNAGLSPRKIAEQYGLDEQKIVEAINYLAPKTKAS